MGGCLQISFRPLRDGEKSLWGDGGEMVLDKQCRACGNIFMDDAIFCRKCGAERQKHAEGGASSTKYQKHVDVLMILFKEWGNSPPTMWGFEECLLASFQAAAKKSPDERCDWCVKVFAEVDRLWLTGPMPWLEAQIKAEQAILNEKTKVREEADRYKKEVCDVQVPAAKEALDRAVADLNSAYAALQKAEQDLHNATQARIVAENEFNYQTKTKQVFEDTVWKDFVWLKAHNTPPLSK